MASEDFLDLQKERYELFWPVELSAYWSSRSAGSLRVLFYKLIKPNKAPSSLDLTGCVNIIYLFFLIKKNCRRAWKRNTVWRCSTIIWFRGNVIPPALDSFIFASRWCSTDIINPHFQKALKGPFSRRPLWGLWLPACSALFQEFLIKKQARGCWIEQLISCK